MTTLIGSLLLHYRTHKRHRSINQLDAHMLADIGITRADFRSPPQIKKTA